MQRVQVQQGQQQRVMQLLLTATCGYFMQISGPGTPQMQPFCSLWRRPSWSLLLQRRTVRGCLDTSCWHVQLFWLLLAVLWTAGRLANRQHLQQQCVPAHPLQWIPAQQQQRLEPLQRQQAQQVDPHLEQQHRLVLRLLAKHQQEQQRKAAKQQAQEQQQLLQQQAVPRSMAEPLVKQSSSCWLLQLD